MIILNLAMANMKKAKSAAFSMFILIFIAALLLNVGATVMSKMSTFYEDKVEELHDAHVSIVMNSASFKQPYEDYLKSYSGVKEAEKESIILLPTATIHYDKTDFSLRVGLLNADASRTIAPLKLIEESDYAKGEGIYLPYGLKAGGGYQLDDIFTLTYQNKKYSYRVAGFFESTLMGSTKLAMLKFFLPEAAYQQLAEELGASADGTLMSAIFANSEQSNTLLGDYNKQFSQSNESADSSFWSADIESAKSSSMTVNIIAMILVAFAAVIVLVSLIVIKFRISNNISDGMVNIGVLKSVGYTSNQIVASFVLQFMLIAVAASVVGVAGSYAVLPPFGHIISSLNKLLWPGGAHTGTDLLSVAIVGLLVLIVALLSSMRIRKLHPIAALRGGIVTHSFKRNPFPLDKAKGSLQLLLANKSMLANSWQNFMIAIIVAAITFASVFSIVLYYNIAEDKKAFFQLVGAETPDIGIQVEPGQDSDQLLKQIKQMNGVEKAIILDFVKTTIEGQLVTTDFSDDYAKLDNPTLYEGRYPEYDNEIAITGGLARLLDKTVGDTLKVAVGDTTYPYLITGLNQSLNSAKNGASLTLEGMRRLIPGHKGMSINVYLGESTNGADFVRDVDSESGSFVQSITDVKESLESQSGALISAFFSVMVAILAITAVIVIMILYLVINTTIRKRKKELGILKATGYTTFQLMVQITLSFIPVVIAGVMVGGVLGSLYTNSVLKLVLFDYGVSNTRFIVSAPHIVILCIAIIVLAYLISMLVSRRIKRITAYGLITE
ncbi:ABC transporter permease [Cohnella abietis]|uniref:ABC3 transporter permease C-terminal domain-containing protein n=1 Tax=Cohnella abietis TaxID=2507935 RepID=A0A3T1DEI3_9BACL|nr:ABC transporter permease [Cohnella abietis]BBI36509.1 hypothetical protein KCTCHS21_59080 [Cohnella abietis]